MYNEDFFDILGDLDDSLISDAAVIPEAPIKRKGTIKSFLLIAAAVTVFIISGFILTDSIKTGNVGVFETTIPSFTTETPSLENTTKDPSGEITTTPTQEETTVFVPVIPETTQTASPPPLTTSAPSPPPPVTEKPSTEEPVTEAPATEEPTTEEPTAEEPSTEEAEVTGDKPPDNTVKPPWDFPDIWGPSAGDTSTDWPVLFFIETPAISFYEKLPKESFDSEKYTVSEEVPWNTLEDIYGTDILPEYIPTQAPSGPTLDSVPENEIMNRKHTVFYSEDKSEAYSSQEFIFDTENDGTLIIKVSTEEFPLYGAEERNMGSKSLINETPVLLLSGKLLTKTVILNATFEKDGCCFRITQKGTNLSEEEFIKILSSLI